MIGPTSNLLSQPRFLAMQFHFVTVVHRDMPYALRLVTRIQNLGERTGSEELAEIARALRIVLLRETSRRWARFAVDGDRGSCTG